MVFTDLTHLLKRTKNQLNTLKLKKLTDSILPVNKIYNKTNLLMMQLVHSLDKNQLDQTNKLIN